jgi:hypothetical protein
LTLSHRLGVVVASGGRGRVWTGGGIVSVVTGEVDATGGDGGVVGGIVGDGDVELEVAVSGGVVTGVVLETVSGVLEAVSRILVAVEMA